MLQESFPLGASNRLYSYPPNMKNTYTKAAKDAVSSPTFTMVSGGGILVYIYIYVCMSVCLYVCMYVYYICINRVLIPYHTGALTYPIHAPFRSDLIS